MTNRLVVVGGGAAGMSAASAARRIAPDLEIVVAEATGDAAWGLCGLPYYLAGIVPDAADLHAYPASFFRDRRGIDLRLHTRVEAVDPDRRTVVLRHEGRTSRLGYQALVLTAGGTAIRPALPGSDDDRVFTVRRLDDTRRLRRLLDAGRVGRALVVGAGYIGLEVADALAGRGCDVVVVELLDRVLPNLDVEPADRVEAETRRHVDLRLGTRLMAVARRDGGLVALLDPGEEEPVDILVFAVGVRPEGSLAASAGADTGPAGAVLVDDRQRTSLPDVFAAGDCVAAVHRVTGQPSYLPLAPAANRMGRVAGIVAAGGDARFPGVVGTAVVKVFDCHVARTGLTLEQARAAGFDALATDADHRSRAKYYPGAAPVHTRLVYEATGRLLGAQTVSTDHATAKHIDVVATALHTGLDIADLGELDLAYAPPYAPVYDPLAVTAATALQAIRPATVPA